jgi:molecular chaperone HtpG
MTASATHPFQAEVTELLGLVINSLYSHKDVFLRELVSNASDAIDKLRFRAISEPGLLEGTPELEIRIVPDEAAGTLTIEDTGIGMTRDELVEHLGTIARSGTKAFLERARAHEKGADLALIGQFGVGFYSAYLVADRVEVVSRAAGATEAHRWSSDAKTSFTVGPAEKATRGTSVILHLKPDQREFLDDWKLRELVRRYSDFVAHPIKLRVAEKGGEPTLETINRASALWQRSPSEVKETEYHELYRHLTHEVDAPLAYTHFRVEGTFLFSGILFVPQKVPFDLMTGGKRRGVRLFVKRVFILEDCEELLPTWLRFVRGVIDSDDLPLNVSREILQDSAVVRTMRKQIVKRTLDRLDTMAKEAPDDYRKFIEAFGPILKEGIALDGEHRDKVAALARFRTTSGEMVSLADYIGRMKPDQKAIYYAIGESPDALSRSPHLETLRAKGYEVLLLTDPVDEWAVDALRSFEGKELTSAMRAELPLEETEEEKAKKEVSKTELSGLLGRMKEILKDRVADVRPSSRLTDSPSCLVVPAGGHHAPMEELLRAAGRDVPPTRRILEINPAHALVGHLRRVAEREPGSQKLVDWVETLFDQAVLTEGGKLEDPSRFARRITALLEEAASRGAESAS